MRRAFRIILTLLLPLPAFLCACTGEKSAFTEQKAPLHFNELRAVEALLETDPVMAMDSVNALKAKASSYYDLDANELLLREVQAQYKNRCLTEESPDLAPVIAFYDSLANLYPEDAELQYLRANAYYYKGAECAFANEDVQAFTQYLNALRVMDAREDWTENPYAQRFTALIFTRLSEILFRYDLPEAAMEACRNASGYYQADADLAAMKRFEAAIYQSQKDYDMALARFQEAQTLVPVGDGMVQLSIGAKLFDLQQYDSAVPHLRQAFFNGDRFSRVEAAAKLAEVFRNAGNTEQELYYTRYYVENSMMESRMASRKMEIEYLFEDFTHPKEEASPREEPSRLPLWYLFVLLLAVIALMAFIIVRNRKRISHIENKITTIEQKHEQETADKEHEIEQISQQLNDTRERLENVQKIEFDEAWRAFTSSAIVSKIRGLVEGKDIMIKSVGVYPKLKLKEMDYIDLVLEANRCFPNFSSRFLKDYPDLNVADLRHSCLGLLGLNDAEIAVLEGISYSGTNRRTNKILTVLGLGDNLEQAIITYLKRMF